MNTEARAKINLCLDITGRMDDGYHSLSMIMQSLELHDDIELYKLPKGQIELSVTDLRGQSLEKKSDAIPTDRGNLMYRAAELMTEHFDIDGGIGMKLTKRIPSQAGLAGGSADAAAVIRGMNELYELKRSQQELMELGLRLGADIPYCISGGTALAEGKGELLTAIDTDIRLNVLLIKPCAGLSTPKVYGDYDRLTDGPDGARIDIHHPDTKAAQAALISGDRAALYANIGNVLEYAVIPQLPLIDIIKKDLIAQGAEISCMTGSGSVVYGLFENAEDMHTAAEHFKSIEYIEQLSDVIETYFI